jgi:hypothetical protein
LPNFSWRPFASNVNGCGRGVHGTWQGAVGTSAANRNFFLNQSGAGNACLSGALRFPRPRLCLTVLWPISSEFRPLLLSQLQNRYISFDVIFLRTFASGSKALSAGPARPPEIIPGTAIRIALRIQGLRTRVFRGIELEHHPLRVRNARI